MKTKIRILLASALAVGSCHQVNAPSNETATVRGQALLAEGFGIQTPPYSGISVSIDGTGFRTVTDDSGLYEFNNVHEGTYNVRFTKPGYGEIRWIGESVIGGGNAIVYWYETSDWYYLKHPTLYKQSDLVTHLESVDIHDSSAAPYGIGSIWLRGIYTGPNSIYTNRITIYFSHSADLSSAPGHYAWFETWGGSLEICDTTSRKFAIPIDLGSYRKHGFNSGDSVYFAAYGTPQYITADYFDYYDPTIRQGVLTAINQTPSPVIGIKIP